MALRSNDGQSSRLLGRFRQFDVRSTPCHVGSNRYGSRLSCLTDNLGFTLVQLGIQHLVLDLTNVHHAREQLADFNGRRSHQNRASRIPQYHNIIDDGIVLFTLRFVHQILSVIP